MKKLKVNVRKWMMLPAIAAAMLNASACSDEDDPAPEPEPQTETTYALLTGDMTQAPYVGYLTAYAEMPSGSVDNIKTSSLAAHANGMRHYGKWIFKRMNPGGMTGNDGIQRYGIDATTGMKEDGQIVSGGGCNFYVYDDATGFYIDRDRGLLKIQKFNPTTMQRTGEIDLSGKLDETTFEYRAVGTSLIAGKEGKLFVDIACGTNAGKGSPFNGDPAPGYIDLAVIDIASGNYEKTIRYEGISYLGYPANENQMWSTGDDGALYFCAHGISMALMGASGSAIIRIKKGATDFDTNWIIRADDYTPGTCIATVCVKDGKLYTQIGTEALSILTMNTAAIHDYYAFETENLSKAPVKIAGMPQSTFVFQSWQGITVIDGKVYFRVENSAEGKNGYYVLGSNNTATEVFNITNGGVIWGFVQLTETINE
jgi:hypothetical protein